MTTAIINGVITELSPAEIAEINAESIINLSETSRIVAKKNALEAELETVRNGAYENIRNLSPSDIETIVNNLFSSMTVQQKQFLTRIAQIALINAKRMI